jgi:hypothetical protein
VKDSVRSERTGWRDLSLSRRHREWGVDCPANDIDLLVEVARGIPVAIIEYKRASANLEDSYQSIRSTEILADRARIAFFVVRYERRREKWYFRIERANAIGSAFLHSESSRVPLSLCEIDFVRLLYRIRKRDDRAVLDLPAFQSLPII